MAPAVDLLVALMALAGEQDPVLGSSSGEGQPDGLLAIQLHRHWWALRGNAAANLVGDGGGRLPTGVVAGQDNVVRSHGRLAHFRALAGISLSPRTEYAPQPARAVGAQSGNGLAQRRRAVRIVHHHPGDRESVG